MTDIITHTDPARTRPGDLLAVPIAGLGHVAALRKWAGSGLVKALTVYCQAIALAYSEPYTGPSSNPVITSDEEPDGRDPAW